MFKYVRFTPFTDEYTMHEFMSFNEKCKVYRFDMPFVSVSCESEADFLELMGYQNALIEAMEITQAEFADMVQHSVQVKRMYDIVNDQYVKECGIITAKYTQEEISTWGTQVAEAEAIKAGSTAPTPFLSALALDEGSTLLQVADKILGLKDANAAYTANALANKWAKLKSLKAEVGL